MRKSIRVSADATVELLIARPVESIEGGSRDLALSGLVRVREKRASGSMRFRQKGFR